MSRFMIFTTEYLTKQHSGYQSRKNKTDGSFGKHEKEENPSRVLVGKTEEKRQRGRTRRR